MKKLDNILILIINLITQSFRKDGDYSEELI